jgi:hypothetical protein
MLHVTIDQDEMAGQSWLYVILNLLVEVCLRVGFGKARTDTLKSRGDAGERPPVYMVGFGSRLLGRAGLSLGLGLKSAHFTRRETHSDRQEWYRMVVKSEVYGKAPLWYKYS